MKRREFLKFPVACAVALALPAVAKPAAHIVPPGNYIVGFDPAGKDAGAVVMAMWDGERFHVIDEHFICVDGAQPPTAVADVAAKNVQYELTELTRKFR